MATSTFSKQFTVKQKKAKEFVAEMTKAVAPTLRRGFKSNSVHLSNEEDLNQVLREALEK